MALLKKGSRTRPWVRQPARGRTLEHLFSGKPNLVLARECTYAKIDKQSHHRSATATLLSDLRASERNLSMPILIDGHNLIGRLSDLRLDDPDDEAKLVARLRTYGTRTRKHITVVFDHGIPGGYSRDLSSGGVKVIFASFGRTADGILRERIRRVRDPLSLTVVTSDHEIITAAQARGAGVMRSEEFANRLTGSRSEDDAGDDAKGEAPISEEEIEEWLRLFQGSDR